jgi:CRISPR/Cas system-associated exonuclease Cas4 (RecB family)
MPSVSHSEVDSYLLCRRKHYYGYTKSLQRVQESAALAMGSAGHKVLEVFYKAILDGLSFDVALAAAKAEADELRQQVAIPANRANIFDTLFDLYFPNEPLVKEGWEILAVEKQFNLEYDPETQAQYPFVVDIIAKSPEGKVVVIDHKFVYDFYNYEASIMQPQIPKYVGALRALNYKIDHGAYNMIRTRKLKESTAEGMLSWLDVKPEPARVQQVFKEQIAVSSDIMAIKALSPEMQDAHAYRVANKMVCQSCSFLDICRTELSGGNSKLMIETEYKIRERKEFVVSEEVEN